MIVRARTVVTMNGPPIENGAVAISTDRIGAVGTFEHVKRTASGDVLDLGEQILLPGLINAHCHLDYTGLRHRISPKKSFAEWVRAINAEKQKLSPADYIQSIHAGIAEAVKSGTTSIVNFEAFPELASTVVSPLRIWWLAELIDVRSPQTAAAVLDSAIQNLKATDRWGLAPHSPFTVSEPLYQMCRELGSREHIPLSTHLAESSEEMAMFRNGSGSLHQFLKSIGRDMNDCGRQTPLARFLEMLSAHEGDCDFDLSNWIVAHLNELSDTDFVALEKMKSKFSLVHCPRSHRYFGHTDFAFDQLRRLGFNICLATDSLASNDDLNLFTEMQLFARAHPGVSPREIVEMTTLNPAKALRHEKLLGQIDEGFWADLIAIPDDRARNKFAAIIANEGVANWSMVAGRPGG